MNLRFWRLQFWRLAGLGLVGVAGAMLAGCDTDLPMGSGRSEQPISAATLAEMTKIDTTPSAPVLIRTFKKEAELEIWKMNSKGQYALLKTYPMCRWSGQLGPKTREGDMQVPEGFYTITPGQMNPNSNYYLAFNIGYPNAYDRAWERTGGSVMVHGVCSSAGCFSMTDAQVADIYAIARDAFRGGQREFQLQSYPFRMTPENMAKYRLDPNIAFWKEIKKGSDYFEVTKAEPPVLVCGRHYVFGARPKGNVSATAACPPMERDEQTDQMVAEKEQKEAAKAEELAASGVNAIRTVYADGGQNPAFAGYKDSSDPEALLSPPQEIVLEERVPAAVRVAAADADLKKRHAELLARIEGLSPAAVRKAEADARKASATAAKLAAAAKVAPAGTAVAARTAPAAPAGSPGATTMAPTETASLSAAPAPRTAAAAQPGGEVQPAAYTVGAGAERNDGGLWGAGSVKKWLHWGGGEAAQQPAATAQVPDSLPAEAVPPRRGAPSASPQASAKSAKPERLALRGLPVPPARIEAGDDRRGAMAAAQ